MKTGIIVFLLVTFFIFSADDEGLRNFSPGDRVPIDPVPGFMEGAGRSVLLYIRSGDPGSILFLRQFAGEFRSEKGIRLFIIDAESEGDGRAASLSQEFSAEYKIVYDQERKIYGKLGIVVIPTALFINDDMSLNSFLSGNRSDLGLFFRAHLKSLAKGERPGNVYLDSRKKLEKRKAASMADRAFSLLLDDNFALAGRMYRKVLEDDPGNVEAALGYGYTLIRLDRRDEAASFFLDRMNSGDSRRYGLGSDLVRALSDPSGPNLTALSKSALTEPVFFPLVHEAGRVLERSGRTEQSSRVFDRCCRILLRLLRRNGRDGPAGEISSGKAA